MRQAAYSDCGKLSVHAIAGTRVVLLGLDIDETAQKGLLGFTIWRTGPDPKNPKRTQTIPLRGGMHFAAADVWYDAESRAALAGKSDRHPIQAFLWGDYIAHPDTDYTYEVIARYGKPGALTDGPKATVAVTTEPEADREHSVYFNRGVAGSQYYARTFDAYRRYYKKMGRWQAFIRPDDVPDRKAFKWLSRGLEEAMLGFIAEAKDETYALRVSAFEFTYPRVIDALVAALERGVDVQATYHAAQKTETQLKGGSRTAAFIDKRETITEADWKKLRAKVKQVDADDPTAAENHAAIASMSFANPDNEARIAKMLTPRKNTASFSHNKIMVMLKRPEAGGDFEPLQVWTGSTNYTEGGIFGQSNVGHVVRCPKVAAAYHEYWKQLHKDADRDTLGAWTVATQSDLDGPPPPGVTPVFSPRADGKMLDWYAERFASARQSVFFTAAFSVAGQIYEAATKKTGPDLRYIMLEKEKAQHPLKSMQEAHPDAKPLDAVPINRIAWGDTLSAYDEDEEDMIEVLTGLNTFVDYLHTKYMLIDPLTDDPIVIAGSANFSENSTVNNDENMLIIRGDTRVADIYLGEFMRLFNHFHIRNAINAMSKKERETHRHLADDDRWTAPYFDKGSQLARERALFAAPPQAKAAAARPRAAERPAPPPEAAQAPRPKARGRKAKAVV